MLFNFLNDTLILTFSEDEEYHIGEIYDVRTGKLIVKCIPKGRGPGELIEAARFRRSIKTGYFEVVDINYNKFASFNLDSVLKFGLKYKPYLFELPLFVNDAVENKRKELICRNRWNMFHDEFDNGVFAFCKYDKLDTVCIDKKTPHGLPHRNSGEWNPSPSGGYVYATRFYGEIQLWNGILKKYKVLVGPNKNKPELYFDKKRGYVNTKDPRSYYTSMCVDPGHFYLGYFDMPIGGYDDFMAKNRMEIFKIDWNGNFVTRFELDKCVHGLYVDSKGEYLYGTRNDFESYPKLYRFKL